MNHIDTSQWGSFCLKLQIEKEILVLDCGKCNSNDVRSYNGPSADGTTFPGKPGKIDYVMVDGGARVNNAWIARAWEDQGQASDHWPVAAVVDLTN